MPNFNTVTLVGHLTRNPENKVTPQGLEVSKFSIAVNHHDKNKTVSFFDCVAFGKTAELIKEYAFKGSALLVDGYLKQERWETTEGDRRSKIVVNVLQTQFLTPKEKADPEIERLADDTFGKMPPTDQELGLTDVDDEDILF